MHPYGEKQLYVEWEEAKKQRHRRSNGYENEHVEVIHSADLKTTSSKVKDEYPLELVLLRYSPSLNTNIIGQTLGFNGTIIELPLLRTLDRRDDDTSEFFAVRLPNKILGLLPGANYIMSLVHLNGAETSMNESFNTTYFECETPEGSFCLFVLT